MVTTHLVLNIRDFTLARDLTSVWNVGRHSRPSRPLSVIVGVTQERNLTSAVHVAKPLAIVSPLVYIREFILGRNRMSVRSVGKPSFRLDTLTSIRESMPERGCTTTGRAGGPSGRLHILPPISGFILESRRLTLLCLPHRVLWISSPSSSGIHPHCHPHSLKTSLFPPHSFTMRLSAPLFIFVAYKSFMLQPSWVIFGV